MNYLTFKSIFTSHNAIDNKNHEIYRGKQRISFGLVTLLLGFFLYWTDGYSFAEFFKFTKESLLPVLAACYTLLGISYFWLLKKNSTTSNYWQYLFFSIDCPMMILLISLRPESLSVFYFLVLFSIIGTGIRYGKRLLKFYIAISSISFTLSIILVDFWRHNLALTIGISVAFTFIPLYLTALVEKIEVMSKKLHEMAMVDSLTGLGNRRALMECLAETLAISTLQNKLFSVVYFDLDNFKKVNDELGHEKGDELLQHIGKSLKTKFRQDDFFARVGGDEFVMLTKIDTSSGLSFVAEKVLEIVSDSKTKCCPNMNVGASIGLYTVNTEQDYYTEQSDKNVTAILKKADEAMYRAKKSGKNKYSY